MATVKPCQMQQARLGLVRNHVHKSTDRHEGSPINDPENDGFPMIFHNWEDEIEGQGSRKPTAALAPGAAVLVIGLR